MGKEIAQDFFTFGGPFICSLDFIYKTSILRVLGGD